MVLFCSLLLISSSPHHLSESQMQALLDPETPTSRNSSNHKTCLEAKWASLVAQMVKTLPVMRETWVRSLGREDTLVKGMVMHSSILAWRIPWTGEPGGLQSMGHTELNMTEVTKQHQHLAIFVTLENSFNLSLPL